MRSELARVFVAVVIATAAGISQNVTVPATMNAVEGGGGTNIPFGSNQACRYQCVYDRQELPWVGPRVITGISLRADGNSPAAMPAKGFLDISVLMSTTNKNSATTSATFADNYGSDATWVINHQLIQLPAQPALLVPPPRPANIDFVFTVPWAYGLTPASGSLPAPDNLLVEIWIHSQPSGLYRVDNLSGCIAPTTSFGLADTLCVVPVAPPAVADPVALTCDISMLAGSSFGWHIANAPPAMPFLVALNLTDQGGLFGQAAWPLPYPMFDPLNPALPSAALAALLRPAPDCWLNIDPVVALSGLTDAAGIGTATGMLPPGRQFVGTTFYAQAIVFSPTSNPLQMITSRGRSSTICGPIGVARNFAFYSAVGTPPPLPPSAGAVQLGVGLVFEVQ